MTEWLVPEADRVLTPKRYAAGHPLCKPLQGVVLHYTASGFKSALNSLTANDKSGSAHFLVGRDGLIKQLAPLSARTWHAEAPKGVSQWLGSPRVNSFTIGVEIENWGFLTPILPAGGSGKSTGWKAWTGQIIPDNQVLIAPATIVKGFETRGKPAPVFAWHRFPDGQWDAVDRLISQLEAAGVPGLLTTHEHTDPTRKFDCGPAYPFEKHLYGGRQDGRDRRFK